MLKISVIALAGLIAACAGTPRPGWDVPLASSEVQAGVDIERSEHQGFVRISGPAQSFGDARRNRYFLRAWNAQGEEEWSTQLYVVANFDNWAFLDRAMRFGTPVEMVEIERNPTGYSVYESVGVGLDQQLMRQLVAVGQTYEVELVGRGGSLTVSVSPEYMQGFLSALEATPKF